jgi:putative ABC transport system substrate-binding protein
VDQQGATAQAMGLELRRVYVRGSSDLDAAAIVRERAGRLVVTASDWPSRGRSVVEFQVDNRPPTLGLVQTPYRAAGGLLYYSFSIAEQHDRVASFVDRILKGVNPVELLVEQPTKVELAINLKAPRPSV